MFRRESLEIKLSLPISSSSCLTTSSLKFQSGLVMWHVRFGKFEKELPHLLPVLRVWVPPEDIGRLLSTGEVGQSSGFLPGGLESRTSFPAKSRNPVRAKAGSPEQA